MVINTDKPASPPSGWSCDQDNQQAEGEISTYPGMHQDVEGLAPVLRAADYMCGRSGGEGAAATADSDEKQPSYHTQPRCVWENAECAQVCMHCRCATYQTVRPD
jgi:hypothetical protein